MIKENKNELIIKIQGGLGNQMFQYAFYRNLKAIGKHAVIDLNWFKKNKMRPLKIWQAFDLPENEKEIESFFLFSKLTDLPFLIKSINWILSKSTNYQLINLNKNKYHIKENDFFYSNAYVNIRKGYLDGYWQSEDYFSNITSEIPKLFKFNPIDNESVLKTQALILSSNRNTSLHWRRGDYVGHKSLGLNLENYFKRALNKMIETKSIKDVFVFTEDTEWVKEKFSDYGLNLNYHFISEALENHEDYHELYLMTQCKSNIISNSSFSWWGAYLNQNKDKTVIAPNKWTNTNTNIRFKDIVPSEWVEIEV